MRSRAVPRSVRRAGPITVDGFRLRWRTGRNRQFEQAMSDHTRVVVVAEEEGVSPLVALCPLPVGLRKSAISPALIERIVRLAPARGWDPTSTAGPFSIADFSDLVE